MNNPVILWVIVGLLILFFFYLVYQGTRTWRVWHVIFVFLVFASAVALSFVVSGTLKVHNIWRTMVRDQTQQIETLTKDRDQLLHGDPALIIQKTPCIESLDGQLRRITVDRGRVWRECTPAQAFLTTP